MRTDALLEEEDGPSAFEADGERHERPKGQERQNKRGGKGEVDGRVIYAGSPVFISELGHLAPTWRGDRLGSILEIADDHDVLGRIIVSDTVKDSAVVAVAQLKDLGITPVMRDSETSRSI